MQIKFKIVEVFPGEQLLVARFYSDVTTEEELAVQKDSEGNILRCRTDMSISLPNPAPTGAELNKFIMMHCPVQFFEMKAAIVAGNADTSLAHIVALKDVEYVAPAAAAPVVLSAEEQKEIEYKAAVSKLLNDAAIDRGYDGIVSACSYAALPGIFQAESISFFNWRTAVWEYCNSLLVEYKAGNVGAPTLPTLLADLPARILPV